jgi:hypothetical protein
MVTDSSKWTGPLDEGVGRWRGAFTHRSGEPAFTNDYARFQEARRIAAQIPPAVRRVMGLATLLLLSPLMLLVAWLALAAITPDTLGQDNRHWLILWGSAVAALAATQITWPYARAIFIRKAILGLALVATAGASVAYVYLGLTSHAGATASAPERAFEWQHSCGRHCTRTLHQRADGSTLEGIHVGAPAQEARSCALTQRLDGPYGFSWVRVLDRSRTPRRGQLAWPISREECFSDEPLSSLPR